MIERWNKSYEELHGERPRIFTIVTGKQESAFVRFKVHSPTENLAPPWNDKEVYKSFVNFYPQQVGNETICFVTGETLPSTIKHSNKIRHAADKAKLISGNDSSGFTFRGRFNKSEEVASISYNASQKAHNALRWLIDKQGTIIDQRVFLVWGNNEVDLANPQENSYSLSKIIKAEIVVTTNNAFAQEFSKAIDGDRKSTRLNSSHVAISYAVFCLKKKKRRK